MNDEVSYDGICKFEIGTIKNHYKVMSFWTNIKKPPKGVFLALKVPGGREVDFSQSKCYLFHNKNICLHILTKFRSKVIVQKVSFLPIFAHFWAFLTPFQGP